MNLLFQVVNLLFQVVNLLLQVINLLFQVEYLAKTKLNSNQLGPIALLYKPVFGLMSLEYFLTISLTI